MDVRVKEAVGSRKASVVLLERVRARARTLKRRVVVVPFIRL
jgi:hypothetical protein